MPPRRRDTQAIPILAAANILAPVPLVELHLRNDRTPSLPPRTDKHTTHPTWYVLPFILCSMSKSALDVERCVKSGCGAASFLATLPGPADERAPSHRIRIRPLLCSRGCLVQREAIHAAYFCFFPLFFFFFFGCLNVRSRAGCSITAPFSRRYRLDLLFRVRRSLHGADRIKFWTRFDGAGITCALLWVRTVEFGRPHRLEGPFFTAAQACSRTWLERKKKVVYVVGPGNGAPVGGGRAGFVWLPGFFFLFFLCCTMQSRTVPCLWGLGGRAATVAASLFRNGNGSYSVITRLQ